MKQSWPRCTIGTDYGRRPGVADTDASVCSFEDPLLRGPVKAWTAEIRAIGMIQELLEKEFSGRHGDLDLAHLPSQHQQWYTELRHQLGDLPNNRRELWYVVRRMKPRILAFAGHHKTTILRWPEGFPVIMDWHSQCTCWQMEALQHYGYRIHGRTPASAWRLVGREKALGSKDDLEIFNTDLGESVPARGLYPDAGKAVQLLVSWMATADHTSSSSGCQIGATKLIDTCEIAICVFQTVAEASCDRNAYLELDDRGNQNWLQCQCGPHAVGDTNMERK